MWITLPSTSCLLLALVGICFAFREFPRESSQLYERENRQLAYRSPPIYRRDTPTNPRSRRISRRDTKLDVSIAVSYRKKRERNKPVAPDSVHLIDPKKKLDTSKYDSGEDSFAVSQVGKSRNVMFSVLDGVGASATPLYPTELTKNFVEIAQKARKPLDPNKMMVDGFTKLIEDNKRRPEIVGSTVGLAAVLNTDDGSVSLANIGDSAVVQIRGQEYMFDSMDKLAATRPFNNPDQININKGGLHRGKYSEILSDSFRTKAKDILIMASDGFFDNAIEVKKHQEMVDIVYKHSKETINWSDKASTDNLAKSIAQSPLKVATANSVQTKEPTAFLKDSAREEQKKSPEGVEVIPKKRGKNDDITILVVVITPRATVWGKVMSCKKGGFC